MKTRIARALRAAADRGASAVEYGLMVAAIAAVIVGVVFGFGQMLGDTFQKTSDCLEARQNANYPTCDPPAPAPGP